MNNEIPLQCIYNTIREAVKDMSPADIERANLDPLLKERLFIAIRESAEKGLSCVRREVQVSNTTTCDNLKIAGYEVFIGDDVHDYVSREIEGQFQVVFFRPDEKYLRNGLIRDDMAEKAYADAGLIPAPPKCLIAVHINEPSFVIGRSSMTHWKNKKGSWCSAAFMVKDFKPRASFFRFSGGRPKHWWLAGIKKPQTA